jgi:vitamin B12 transporter
VRAKLPLSAGFAAVLTTLSISPGAQAQPTPAAGLEPVVITASRTEQALPDALLSTKVISHTQIELSQAVDLPALLRMYTSIDVAQTGPLGSQTGLFVRGAESRQVLLVVDGIAMNRANDGGASWEHLAIAQIERVEVVRGDASSLWGDHAVGGVVQIITRRASGLELSLGLGTQRSAQAAAAGGWRLGDGDRATRLSFAASQRASGAFNAGDPATGASPDRDAFGQSSASLRVEQGWGAGQQSSLTASTTHTRSAYDGDYRFSDPAIDPLSRDDQLSRRIDTLGLSSRHALTPAMQLGVDAGLAREALRDATAPDQFGSARASNTSRQAQLQLQWEAAAGHRLIGAAETHLEAAEDSDTPRETRRTRTLRAAWLGRYAFAGQALETQANLRRDDNSLYGQADTGLIALAWLPVAPLRLSAQWGTAFSAPSFFNQRFAVAGSTLRPERSHNAELALHWQAEAASVRVAWFRQRQSDRIAGDGLVHLDSKSLVNIAHAANNGIELLGQAQWGGTTLSGESTWQNARNLDTGAALQRRARQTQALSMQQGLGSWDAGAALRHSGQRSDFDPVSFGVGSVPARTTLALSGGYKVSPVWRLAAKLDNATNNRSPEVLGYNPAPRSLGLSLSGKL